MSLATVLALISTPAMPLLVGAFGSFVEHVGKVANRPRVEAVGRALEAVAADFPKLLANVKAVASGKRVQ